MTQTAEQDQGEAVDIRPLVARDTGNRPLWIGMAVILGLGLLLFLMLETRRQDLSAPAVKARLDDLAWTSAVKPPPLYIPPDSVIPLPAPEVITIRENIPETPAPAPVSPAPSALPAAVTQLESVISNPAPMPPTPQANSSPLLVLDASMTEPDGPPNTNGGAPAVASRARASRLRNRATVVPQGTLIAAVLETALDSTQPGQARALVSSDVVNLRGDRILIPRGSRLFGEYKGDIAPGQKRAFVQWTRLVRPDGVTIAIDSPAADQLGRAGIKGRVNSHFFERLTGALLQSTIDIGTIVASGKIYDGGDSVFISVPGSVQGATSQIMGPAPKPTLKVRQGRRISVFVMRDLDFTSVEAGR
ncbi:TrbI/VirB10 family protein [Rhizorhapis suberifaciens]|uniref:Type IV secretion system protein VirB10 n=1 Tax=Rhizorhapis suberifaciens TaxID=13656 RepID=A0A840HX86_9SPHN|nr:TrbI/VirB10 family protein [Rhizorhapis suberifaciens]MBB4642583.1 type IV secretion system protein VirB10 [Rhizorhapis suberifaciens]